MRRIFFALSLLLTAAVAGAQQLTVTAEVDKTQVTLDEQVVLAVTVTGPQTSLPDPQMPSLQNFSMYSSGRNQSISFINGRVSSSVIHTFVLIPRTVGKGIIGPITVSAQGASAKTDPIEIEVVKSGNEPAAAPQARPAPRPAAASGPDIFVTTELDRRRALVNEQVTLSFKFYTAVSLMGNPEYNPPKLEGFLTEDLPPLRHYNVIIKGRPYYVTEIKMALFPLQTGKLSIGPATVHCQVQQDITADPFASDFFDKFFSQGLITPKAKTMTTQPLTLQVDPIPSAGRPPDFNGAVGRFSLSASLDKTRAKVGDAVTLSMILQGSGNLKSLGNPDLPELPSWRVFDPVASVNEEKRGDQVQGSRVTRTVLVPRVSGELTIPPIALSYFDTDQQRFVRLQTKSMTVSVAPGEANATPAVGYISPTASVAKGLSRVNEDIAYLKVKPQTPAWTKLAESWTSAEPLHTLPFLFFAWALGLHLYRERLASDPKGARARGALKAARARLSSAGRAADSKKAVGLMAEALTGYLADKLGEPAPSLTLRRALELLRAHHLPETSLARAQALWEELDSRRFAPSRALSSEMPAFRGDLDRLLKSLDKELKP